MRFWDASALVQLLVIQTSTFQVLEWTKADPSMVVWWAAKVECASALERLAREGALIHSEKNLAMAKLGRMALEWNEIDPTPRVRDTAMRFLRVHTLRAADALQLAAAFVASESNPPALEFVCLDQRLSAAGEKEGFRILGETPK